MTEEQLMNILRDAAIFSDGPSARTRAVHQLAQDYEIRAIPIINEIIDSLPYSEKDFKKFCSSVIEKIRYNFGEGI
jgi:hypothetical protein